MLQAAHHAGPAIFLLALLSLAARAATAPAAASAAPCICCTRRMPLLRLFISMRQRQRRRRQECHSCDLPARLPAGSTGQTTSLSVCMDLWRYMDPQGGAPQRAAASMQQVRRRLLLPPRPAPPRLYLYSRSTAPLLKFHIFSSPARSRGTCTKKVSCQPPLAALAEGYAVHQEARAPKQ